VTGKRRRGRDDVPPPAPATPPPSPPPLSARAPAPPAPAPPAPAPLAPAAPTPPPKPPVEAIQLPPLTRRQLRIDRRKRRRKVGVAGAAGIVVVALVIIAAIAFGVHKAVTNTHHTAAQPQQTVLLQIQGPDNTALSSVLLAHNPNNGGSGLELLLPSQLITDVCGVGQVTFGQTLAAANGVEVSRQAASAALGGIIVKGSWVLTTTSFAQLVTAVGGVTVNVDTNVISRGPNGSSIIDIPAGNRHLTGPQAVEYATYRTSTKEDAASQLARFQEVVDALIRGLPATTSNLRTNVLDPLGTSGASTLGAGPLSTLLVGLAADDRRTGGVLPIDLPTTLIDIGGSPSYQVDPAKTAQLVKNQLGPSLPPAPKVKPLTVELRNGVGSPGLVATACPRLAAAGLVYAGQGNASSFNVARSEVQINSDSSTDLAQGARVARALRLPSSDVTRAQLGQDQANVVVILGRDYRP
jgi:hypothetical protein